MTASRTTPARTKKPTEARGTRHVFLALTNPTLGREDDFNRWYDRHINEVLERYEGFYSGRRYWANSYQVGRAPLPWKHLAMYEVETDDVERLHTDQEAYLNAGGLTSDDGAIAQGAAAWIFRALADDAPLPTEQHVYLALTNAAAGRERDFTEWYERHHLREIVEHTPGFVAGRRFERATHQRTGQSPPWRYLAIYQVEADDIGASLDSIVPLIKQGVFTSPRGALDPDHAGWTYTPAGSRLHRSK